MAQDKIPSFVNPPVVEVVWSVQFTPLSWLTAAHVGCFWQKIRDKYPKCEEQAPINRKIEGDELLQFPQFTIQAGAKLPLARQWFISETGTEIVQLQTDRFCVNWRQWGDNREYPRYDHMMAQFTARWGQFLEFITEVGEEAPDVDQLEMTYVNHIYKDEGWSKPSEIDQVFPAIRFHRDFAFLPLPATLGCNMIFDIAGTGGRLHVSCRHAMIHQPVEPEGEPENRELFRLDLVARGRPDQTNTEGICQWYAEAREWIVRGFADLTNPDIQQSVWKKEA